MARKITIPSQDVEEAIIAFEVVRPDSRVSVHIGRVEDHDIVETVNAKPVISTIKQIMPGSQIISISIEGDYYDALMSEKPAWSNKKPEGMFNDDDLWIVVDAIREGVSLPTGKKMQAHKL